MRVVLQNYCRTTCDCPLVIIYCSVQQCQATVHRDNEDSTGCQSSLMNCRTAQGVHANVHEPIENERLASREAQYHNKTPIQIQVIDEGAASDGWIWAHGGH